MTTHQLRLISATWELICVDPQSFARKFYEELFSRSPRLRHLFADDINEQAEKFTEMIDAIVQRLKAGHELNSELRALGKRHAGYGVEARDYTPVAEAFIAALQQFLGAALTAEIKSAWTAAYLLIADEMQRGVEE